MLQTLNGVLVAVTLQICIRECSVRISAGLMPILTMGFRDNKKVGRANYTTQER
jgi:hypothetical protein